MTSKRDQLADIDPEMLTADGFDDALVGYAEGCGRPTVAVYDYRKCLEILQHNDGMTFEGAVEHFEYNVIGAYVGEQTPMFLHRLEEEEEDLEQPGAYDDDDIADADPDEPEPKAKA